MSHKGYKFSEKHKARIGQVMRKRWLNPEYRRAKLLSMRQLRHSPETKEKLRKAATRNGLPSCSVCGDGLADHRSRVCSKCCAVKIKGAGNPNWKGGATPLHAKIRTSGEYARWRLKVLERDGFRCVSCGKTGGVLDVHHILPFVKYLNLRFSVCNGTTLCKNCHQQLHSVNRAKKHA